MEKTRREFRYYKLLGLDENASSNEIKRSYRLLMKKYHTDINPNPEAVEIAKRLNQVYSVLSNPQKKKTYDNNNAECPNCWGSYEIIKVKGDSFNKSEWRCRECGCNFTFIPKTEKARTSGREEDYYEEYYCPRCKHDLKFDKSIKLYRCTNKKCKSAFSPYELRKNYSRYQKDSKDAADINKKARASSSGSTKYNPETTDNYVLSNSERNVIRFTAYLSLFFAIILLFYLMLFSFSFLMFGVFLLLIGLTLLSHLLQLYPKLFVLIKSLIIRDNK